MIGILIELIISWLLLWFIERGNLSSLGLIPSKPRMVDLLYGFIIAALFCTVYHLRVYFADNSWKLNPHFNLQQLVSGTWWVLKSVLFEELLFRGALLYIAVKKLGPVKACFLSAACFGVYHWFTMGSLGNPVQMIIVFLMTAIAGLAFAYAFVKTRSMYLPMGLHFGWNYLTILIFSNGPLGQQLLLRENHDAPQGVLSLVFFLFQVLALPFATYLYLRKKKHPIIVS